MGGVIIDGKIWDGARGMKMMLWRESAALITRFIAKEKLVGNRLQFYLGKKRIGPPIPFPGIPEPHLH